MKCNTCIKYILPIFAAVFIGLSFMLYFYAPIFLRHQIEKTLPIVNTSESHTFTNWQTIPYQIMNSLYLFNVTNADAVINGAKPILHQLGPYVFVEKRVKRNLTWLPESNHCDGDATVKYKQYKRWHFVPELSNGTLSDNIQHVNVPLVTAGNAVHSKLLYDALNIAVWLTRSKLFPVHTAGELLFDGYTDAFMKFISRFVKLPFDRFGWFHGKNNSADGIYQIYTGKSGLEDIGKMISWRNESEMNIWNGKCKSFDNVFTGDIYPPFQSPTPMYFKMFLGEICRPMKLFYKDAQSIYGVAANRFMVTESSLNYTLSENQCYCANYVQCPADGLLNISACMQNAPIGVSLPNFLFADSVYRNKIDGLPEADIHENGFYVDIDPILGIPVRFAVRVQVNVYVQRNEKLKFSKNLKESAYYPQIWFDVSAGIDENMAKQLRLYQKLTSYINIFACTVLVIGLILTAIWIYFVTIYRFRPKMDDALSDTVPIVNATDDTIST